MGVCELQLKIKPLIFFRLLSTQISKTAQCGGLKANRGFALLREFSLLHLIMRKYKVAVGISISCMHWIKIYLPVKMKLYCQMANQL